MLEEQKFENVLKSFRVRKGKEWTQVRTAHELGVSRRLYVGWENGESVPLSRDLKNIVALFRLSTEDEDALYRAAAQVSPKIHNLPFPQNPFFTGRQAYLEQLDRLLREGGSVAPAQPVGISGLGGIGKTQLALEYAHRCYPKKYRAVFWVNAADKTTLETDYLSLARLLALPEQHERITDQVIHAVKRWLESHTDWLLVMDNAGDLQLTYSFLPEKPLGHTVMTTRSQIVGDANIATQIKVEAMEPEEGLLFLLRRSGVLRSVATLDTLAPEVREAARQLVQLLGRHSLVLDHAGAYIEETGASFTDYLQLYREERASLLDMRGPPEGPFDYHPETIVATVMLSFRKACERHPLVADTLYFCSFLQPDAMPEEVFYQESGLNHDLRSFNEVIAATRQHSLVERNSQQKMLSMHRLVQAVLQDIMEQGERRSWTQRALRAVNATFPDPEFGGTWPQRDWPRCERLVRHGLQLAAFIETEPIVSEEAGALLHKAALYLANRGQFTEVVEQLYRQALEVKQKMFGPEHPAIASSLNGLATLCYEQSRYAEAEPLYQRALQMREHLLGPEHPDLVSSLNGLAKLYYYAKANYTEAESLYQRGLRIAERHLGQEHPYMGYLLMNLANLYSDQGKYEPAESHYKRALHIWEEHLGPEHPRTALCLNNLGTLYYETRDYVQAESYLQRARHIWEQVLGEAHPQVAWALNNLAEVFQLQHKYTDAEPLYQRALHIWEEHLGPEHTGLAHPLSGLADLYRRQEKYGEARQFYKRALFLRIKAFGLQHPDTAAVMDGLGQLHEAQGRYEKARILYASVRAIRERVFGHSHPATIETYQRSIALLHTMGRHEAATQLEATLQTTQTTSKAEKSYR